jgi:hypothetical protein
MALKLDKSNLVKNLAKNTKFAYHLDRAIGLGDFEWEYKYKPKTGDTGWHPSGHCTPSMFELYHHAIGNSPDPKAKAPDGTAPIQKNKREGFTAQTLKTFQVGHFWHGYLQHLTVEVLGFAGWEDIERKGVRGWGDSIISGVDHDGKEVRHYQDWHYVAGSGDVAPLYIPTHGPYLVDFKTMGDFDFKKPGLPDWCADKYECQINIYMDFFDLDRALIIGVQKGTPHDFKEIEFHRNQPLVDALYEKWQIVSACIEDGTVPPEDEVIDLPLTGPVAQ